MNAPLTEQQKRYELCTALDPDGEWLLIMDNSTGFIVARASDQFGNRSRLNEIVMLANKAWEST